MRNFQRISKWWIIIEIKKESEPRTESGRMAKRKDCVAELWWKIIIIIIICNEKIVTLKPTNTAPYFFPAFAATRLLYDFASEIQFLSIFFREGGQRGRFCLEVRMQHSVRIKQTSMRRSENGEKKYKCESFTKIHNMFVFTTMCRVSFQIKKASCCMLSLLPLTFYILWF